MKTALFTLAVVACLVVMSSSAEAAPDGSQSYRPSSPAVTQLAGGYGHSHYSHHGHGDYDRGHGYNRGYYPSQHYHQGYQNYHNHGGHSHSYYSGYGYPSSGIGFSGPNFSFYYGF